MALLKDRIDPDLVGRLADAIHQHHNDFDREAFVRAITPELDDLELKDRISLIADTMAEHLPSHYPTALAIVVRTAEAGIDEWAAWPLCTFVERHGTTAAEASLAAMPALTRRWSCEFAIRPFLDDHLDLTVEHMRRWVTDEDEAVRRLPSEGSRPFLPWGPKVPALIDNPEIGVELVTALRHDPSETVRRSVANHLNDLSKFQPDLVVDLLGHWTAETDPVDDKMVRHALRTLVKNGHPGALALLGFTTEPRVSVGHFCCAPARVGLGTHIELAAAITSTSDGEQRLVIDFVIHHVNAAGSTSPKVFKWTTLTLAPGDTVELKKRRLIRNASTRTYHPGVHRIDLQVGGRCLAGAEFELLDQSDRSQGPDRPNRSDGRSDRSDGRPA